MLHRLKTFLFRLCPSASRRIKAHFTDSPIAVATSKFGAHHQIYMSCGISQDWSICTLITTNIFPLTVAAGSEDLPAQPELDWPGCLQKMCCSGTLRKLLTVLQNHLHYKCRNIWENVMLTWSWLKIAGWEGRHCFMRRDTICPHRLMKLDFDDQEPRVPQFVVLNPGNQLAWYSLRLTTQNIQTTALL